ncbi:MAG: helix-turn-helix transcriptional regulator [Armatimonadetes bacterium]|nr:helix-turn-helix transcriptional regulator [Armatimonadota bacterium]
MDADFERRLDNLVRGLASTRGLDATNVARAFDYSVAQTYRLFAKTVGESPGRFRRRLLLERAAAKLSTPRTTVGSVAVEAGYGSTEGFARAFEKSFKTKPTEWRKRPGPYPWLPAPSGIHYWQGAFVRSMSQGTKTMNPIRHMVAHDLWTTSRLLDRAQTLGDDALDASLIPPVTVVAFEGEDKTLRVVLDRLVMAKEVWVAAIKGREFDFAARDSSVAGMIARHAASGVEFSDLVEDLDQEGKWDDLFIDAMCCPPETFTFGGVVAHVLNFAAVRRSLVLREFARLGHDDLGYGDPIDYERKAEAGV